MTDSGLQDRFFTLDYEKVLKLEQVLEEPVHIHSSSEDCPSVLVKPVDLIRAVEARIVKSDDLFLRDVRLNGSAATWVVDSSRLSTTSSPKQTYNDIDVIFRLDNIPNEFNFHGIINAALCGFADAVRSSGQPLSCFGDCEAPNPYKIKEAYGRKLVRVWTESEQWCLISFHNLSGLDLELKFVGRSSRAFEFSVDSFQVVLDSYIALKKVSEHTTPHIFPTVDVEVMWGDAQEALRHVNEKWIATRKPETIRGGGLLKYCRLLVQGYRPAYPDLRKVERYMCSRFFIDFPSPTAVESQISKYLQTHFRLVRAQYVCASQASAFLWTLLQVVEVSAECLSISDRTPVLKVIVNLARTIEQPFVAVVRQLPVREHGRRYTRGNTIYSHRNQASHPRCEVSWISM